MPEINWRAEALTFCKEADIYPSTTLLQHVEMAMQKGALLVIDQQIKAVKSQVAKVKRPENDWKTDANIRPTRR